MADDTQNFGPDLNIKTVDKAILTGPGEELVQKTIQQLSLINGFQKLFGKLELDSSKLQSNNRVVGYNRQDWPLRMLPALNIFPVDGEEKSSDNAWLTGSIGFFFFFPAKMRRQDLSEVPTALKGGMENFFASDYVKKMMDPHVSLYNPATVFGLNEYGKEMTWTPNVEAILENQKVPATLLKARYRIDLRAWYRAMEQQLRTKADPFEQTLTYVEQYLGGILGVDDKDQAEVVVPLTIEVTESP